MAVSFSVALLLLVMAVVFLRSGRLRFSHALVCVLLGFQLSGSSMAPGIEEGLAATASLVSGLDP